jgi:DNA-binding MarR family transcriptional regulator
LSSARWQVLGVVEHGPAPVATVARTMGLARQSVQQTADALERDGLIEYRENPHHRRAKLMCLTPAGRDALDDVQDWHAGWSARIGGQLDPESLRAATELLRRLGEQLERDSHGEEAS